MRTTAGSIQINVVGIQPGRSVTVYRIVRSGDRRDPLFLNSLRSNYELGEEPRKIERSSTAIHMGISAYLEEQIARGTAQKFPKLGDYVAVLVLEPDNGFNYAHTGHPKHLTLWADPIKLRNVVADIGPVWE